MIRTAARSGVVLMGLLVLVCGSADGAEMKQEARMESLQAQIRALAADQTIAVSGLERLGDAPTRRVAPDGDLRQRLSALLAGYNHLLLHGADGGIAGVRILGRGEPSKRTARSYEIATTRRGATHVVDATLTGEDGAGLQMPLILDTGASTVVLPASAMEALGFDAEDLTDAWALTAGGRVQVRVGTLASMRVGQASARDVAVSFIDDEAIGDKALLGMSFLERFHLTLKDAQDRVILLAR